MDANAIEEASLISIAQCSMGVSDSGSPNLADFGAP
jgi:hypothetical protein